MTVTVVSAALEGWGRFQKKKNHFEGKGNFTRSVDFSKRCNEGWMTTLGRKCTEGGRRERQVWGMHLRVSAEGSGP